MNPACMHGVMLLPVGKLLLAQQSEYHGVHLQCFELIAWAFQHHEQAAVRHYHPELAILLQRVTKHLARHAVVVRVKQAWLVAKVIR